MLVQKHWLFVVTRPSDDKGDSWTGAKSNTTAPVLPVLLKNDLMQRNKSINVSLRVRLNIYSVLRYFIHRLCYNKGKPAM